MTCKAIIYERPEVISIITHTVRKPAAGEVRILVKAAAVNPTDLLLRKMVQSPVIPGMDAAGIIESVGPGETRLQPGDEVMAVMHRGAQASCIIAPAASVVLKPKNSTFAQAATLPMNGLTALRALELAGLQSGQTLAVTGGAGLVAHYTIAFATQQGLTIIADAKPAEKELVRSYGADTIITRGEQFPQIADALIDTATIGSSCFTAIRDGGKYIHLRYRTDDHQERNIHSSLVWVPDVLERTSWLEQLKEMVQTKKITLRVTGEYPPEAVETAHQALAAGGLRGRPVILF